MVHKKIEIMVKATNRSIPTKGLKVESSVPREKESYRVQHSARYTFKLVLQKAYIHITACIAEWWL